MIENCVGCDAKVQKVDGPIHRYMTSASACWRRYGELLNDLYTLQNSKVALIVCVDTYAVQHPGTSNPQAIQSVRRNSDGVGKIGMERMASAS